MVQGYSRIKSIEDSTGTSYITKYQNNLIKTEVHFYRISFPYFLSKLSLFLK